MIASTTSNASNTNSTETPGSQRRGRNAKKPPPQSPARAAATAAPPPASDRGLDGVGKQTTTSQPAAKAGAGRDINRGHRARGGKNSAPSPAAASPAAQAAGAPSNPAAASKVAAVATTNTKKIQEQKKEVAPQEIDPEATAAMEAEMEAVRWCNEVLTFDDFENDVAIFDELQAFLPISVSAKAILTHGYDEWHKHHGRPGFLHAFLTDKVAMLTQSDALDFPQAKGWIFFPDPGDSTRYMHASCVISNNWCKIVHDAPTEVVPGGGNTKEVLSRLMTLDHQRDETPSLTTMPRAGLSHPHRNTTMQSDFLQSVTLLTRFISTHTDPCPLPFNVVYNGAGTGEQVLAVMSIFPSLRFHLFDPALLTCSAEHIKALQNANCTVYGQNLCLAPPGVKKPFLPWHAQYWSSRRHVLISDVPMSDAEIASLTFDRHSKPPANLTTARDLVTTMWPVASMVKFDLRPCGARESVVRYIPGAIWIPPFADTSSSETRLVSSRNDIRNLLPLWEKARVQPTIENDKFHPETYRGQMAHHQQVARFATYDTALTTAAPFTRSCRCLDCAVLVHATDFFLDKMFRAIVPEDCLPTHDREELVQALVERLSNAESPFRYR